MERHYTMEEDAGNELVGDLIKIVAQFAGRLYGRRSHEYKRPGSEGACIRLR